MRLTPHSICILLTGLAVSACRPALLQSTSTSQWPGAPAPAAKPYDCALDEFASDGELPLHQDFGAIEVRCLDRTNRDQGSGRDACARAIRALACASGADFIHATRQHFEDGTITVTATTAILGAPPQHRAPALPRDTLDAR